MPMLSSLRTIDPAVRTRRTCPGEVHSLPRLVLVVLATVVGTAFGPLTPPAGAEQGFGEIVKAFCLSAFETEMEQAGKVPPAGMADYACGCMAGRLRGGSSIDTARAACRQETVKRFPI